MRELKPQTMEKTESPSNPKKTDDAIAKTMASQNSRKQRAMWLGNIRLNQKEIEKGYDIKVLHDVFWNIPGIVIGAGPSLNKNLHLLKGEEKKYPLFCCDRAYKKCKEADVTPQIVIATDVSDEVAGFFSDMDVSRAILVAATYISPLLLKLPWRKKIFYNVTDVDKGYESAALNLSGRRITAIPGSLIVGNIAFFVSKIAGCNPITFIGNDLSMAEPSRRLGEISYESTDKDGNKIYSLPGFLAGLEWILKYMSIDKDIKTGILKVYNSTEGGIMYNENIKGIPLKEFMSKHPGTSRSLKTMLEKRLLGRLG